MERYRDRDTEIRREREREIRVDFAQSALEMSVKRETEREGEFAGVSVEWSCG